MPLQFLLLQHWDFCIMSNFMFNSSNSKIVTNEETEATDYFNVQMAWIKKARQHVTNHSTNLWHSILRNGFDQSPLYKTLVFIAQSTGLVNYKKISRQCSRSILTGTKTKYCLVLENIGKEMCGMIVLA